MSKKKHKFPFDLPPKTLEKYMQTLAQSTSGDTTSSPNEEASVGCLGPTDSSLRSDLLLTKAKKENEFMVMVKKVGQIVLIGCSIVGGIAILGTILYFFWGMNNSIDVTKQGLEKVTIEVKELAKETRTQDQDIKISLTKILEKFDRLFDNLQKNKK
jgi:hypothetical protein